MSRILALGTTAFLLTTASAVAAPVTLSFVVGGKTCTTQVALSNDLSGTIDGTTISLPVLVATETPAGGTGNPCNGSTSKLYGQGIVGKVTPATGVTHTEAIVGASASGLNYITAISLPFPKVGGKGTIDAFTNDCAVGGTNCFTLKFLGATPYTRTK